MFKSQNLEQATKTLSKHMPTGRAWAFGSDNSIMYDLFSASALPFKISQDYIETLARELDINQTIDLISEWEESVDIPDGCIFGEGVDINLRRQQVIFRFRKVPFVKLADLQLLVDTAFPGFTIVLHTGTSYYETFEYDFEVIFMGDIYESFIIVAEIIGSEGIDQGQLRCLLEKVIPANAILIIEVV